MELYQLRATLRPSQTTCRSKVIKCAEVNICVNEIEVSLPQTSMKQFCIDISYSNKGKNNDTDDY